MRSPWLQLVLLLLYLLLVLVVSRLLDLVLWYQHGVVSTQLVDPLLLSVRQLKLLLDTRGVSYAGYAEKRELAELLEDSAEVTHGEVEQVLETAVSFKERLLPAPASSYFTGGAHFYEEVEDTRDSVWLVQVVVAGEPLLDDYRWRLVCGQLEPFAIRTGIFDCRQDNTLCESKRWKEPRLLLAMPRGTKPKDKVVLQPFTSNNPKVIVDWIRKQLSVWVKKIKDVEEIEREWIKPSQNHSKETHILETSENSVNSLGGIQVLLLSHLLHPPLFLAALSIKFTGRIRFGMLSVKKEDSELIKRRLKLTGTHLPCYLIVTPEKTVSYGKRKMEYFNLKSMNSFLRGIQPEMNDVFLCSLVLVNMLVSLIILQTSGQLWWKWAAQCLWTLVSYNLWLFGIWLLVLGTSRFAAFSLLVDRLLVFLRLASLSDAGSLIRIDWAFLSSHPVLFAICFIGYGLTVSWLLRRWLPTWVYPQPSDVDAERRAWWEVLPVDSYWVNCLFRPMASLSRPLPPSQVELEELMLIERLAVPNFWLQPVIPTEYIKDLPIWQFRSWTAVDVPQSAKNTPSNSGVCFDSLKLIERVMDGEEPQSVLLCCCVCTRERFRVRPHPSPKVGAGSRDVAPKSEHVNEVSQCTCSVVPGWSGTPKHKCRGPFTAPGRCQRCRDCCENLRDSGASETMCVACCHKSENCRWKDDPSHSLSESEYEENDVEGLTWTAPRGMLPTPDCAVCLEPYRYGTVLCGLPCGHSYHQRCILAWLQRDNHHCPVCRWPAYCTKNARAHLHQE